MRKINFLGLGFILAGCFLGAGFLSGNELKQFFGNFGWFGILGCIISVAAICLFGYMIIEISNRKNSEKIEDIILPFRSPIIGNILAVLQMILVFAIIVIMTSGAATLMQEIIGVDRVVAALIFSIILAAVTLFGVSGISAFFSVFVPVIAAFSLGISIFVCAKNGLPNINAVAGEDTNPLLSHWLLASIAYLSYSVFSSIGMISPLAKGINKKSTTVLGSIFGGVILFVIAAAIMFSVYCASGSIASELPMLSVAFSVNNVVGNVYAVLLLGGMFGAALTSMMSISNYIKLKFTKLKLLPIAIALAILNFFGSLVGFGDLIGTVYPLFGYLGLIVLGLITFNFILTLKTPKNK